MLALIFFFLSLEFCFAFLFSFFVLVFFCFAFCFTLLSLYWGEKNKYPRSCFNNFVLEYVYSVVLFYLFIY